MPARLRIYETDEVDFHLVVRFSEHSIEKDNIQCFWYTIQLQLLNKIGKALRVS